MLDKRINRDGTTVVGGVWVRGGAWKAGPLGCPSALQLPLEAPLDQARPPSSGPAQMNLLPKQRLPAFTAFILQGSPAGPLTDALSWPRSHAPSILKHSFLIPTQGGAPLSASRRSVLRFAYIMSSEPHSSP